MPAVRNQNLIDQMTSEERLTEVADILARGLVRLRARQSRLISEDCPENSVDFSVDLRGHVAPNPNVGAAE
jgi:hypothetical protein